MDEKERNDSEELDDPEELDEAEEDEDDSGVDVERTSTEELRSLIQRKDRTGLTLVFDTVPNIDIAEEANDLTPEELIYIFHNVSSEYTADFFDDLSLETKENLIRAMTDKDLVKVINSQAADDVADAVGSMPANLASKVLMAADKDMRKDI
ncbi:MAG: magnesium transporter MgtE N-terminal domain-containing protein, partial [Candidatus Enteromonas sp.]